MRDVKVFQGRYEGQLENRSSPMAAAVLRRHRPSATPSPTPKKNALYEAIAKIHFEGHAIPQRHRAASDLTHGFTAEDARGAQREDAEISPQINTDSHR